MMIIIMIIMVMTMMTILKLFAVHSETRYKHNAAKLLAELDFSECEFAFSIFLPRQALRFFSLSVSLKNPLSVTLFIYR